MRTCRSGSPIAGTCCRPGVSYCPGRRRNCSSTRICARPTLAVDVSSLPGRIRHRFPVFEQQVYINSCSQGALSDSVREAYARYLDDWDEHGAPWGCWGGRLEPGRAAIAGLVNADEDEIAVTTSVSAGVSSLVSGLRFDDGRDTIVVSDFEFPTIGQISHAQERRGVQVVHVPAEADGTIPLERFEAAIDERTALVAVTHVCFRNGGRLDVEGIGKIAHAAGAPILVDAYQTIGSLPHHGRAPARALLAAGA